MGIAALVLLAAKGGAWFGPRGAAAPPTLGDLAAFDDTLAAQVRADTAAVQAHPDQAAAWLSLAMTYDANELSLTKAAACYAQAITLGPADPRPRYYAALLHARQGALPEAIAAMRAAVERAGGAAPPRWHLGLLLLDAGDLDAAEVAFGEATHLDADDAAGWLGLGRVALQRKLPDQAIAALRRAAKIASPAQAYALQLLATTQQRAEQVVDEPAAAVPSGADPASWAAVWTGPWDRDLASRRISAMARVENAARQLGSGHTAAAVATLEALQRERPDDLVVAANLGVAYIRQGRHDDAAHILAESVRRDPDQVQLRENYASALINQASATAGDQADQLLAKAMVQLDAAVALLPTRARSHALRGEVLLRRHDAVGAAVAFREAALLDPRDQAWPTRAAAADEQAAPGAVATELAKP